MFTQLKIDTLSLVKIAKKAKKSKWFIWHRKRKLSQQNVWDSQQIGWLLAAISMSLNLKQPYCMIYICLSKTVTFKCTNVYCSTPSKFVDSLSRLYLNYHEFCLSENPIQRDFHFNAKTNYNSLGANAWMFGPFEWIKLPQQQIYHMTRNTSFLLIESNRFVARSCVPSNIVSNCVVYSTFLFSSLKFVMIFIYFN